MSLAIVFSRANIGVDAPLISVEAHLSNGLPGFSIVGLPETAVKESKERVRSALLNSHLEFPDKRITINLAPADLPKSGGRFDLAIAIGILAASGQVSGESLQEIEFLGELALSGEIRGVTAVLPGILAAKLAGRSAIIPGDNAGEAGLVSGGRTRSARHLLDVVGQLTGQGELDTVPGQSPEAVVFQDDMQDVVGQHGARRALTVAAAGGHNLLMQGPPGTGKTMLASRICSILPPLAEEAALEVAAIRSIAGAIAGPENWRQPPFRSPHHTASAVALVGGGSSLKVGEISLAHHGILFLDELPEFNPKVLEVMREPLESGRIAIARASYQVLLPARFQLIAAMNPCPCGYRGDPDKTCLCGEEKIRKYQGRISGPVLDRIDMHIHVPRLKTEDKDRLLAVRASKADTSAAIREKVTAARDRQLKRSGKTNATLSQAEIREHCRLAPADEQFLSRAMQQWQLSARGFFRILKMSRTLADLDGVRQIQRAHLLEAMAFRFPRQSAG